MSVHLCNTFFEQELETAARRPLLHWLRSHPIFLQLQFLPLLYAREQDTILVSDLPANPDPRLQLIGTSPLPSPIDAWAPSLAIASWAKTPLPNWDLLRQINSKIFSFTHSSKLPGAALLHSPEELTLWLERTRGPRVLKTPFGTAGRGHFHVGSPAIEPFVKRQFDLGLPIIGEPWVERILDFSTQWRLGEKAELLGVTTFENDPKGQYLATRVGSSLTPFEWALEKHFEAAEPLVAQIADLGLTGNFGIDAFVYRSDGKEQVHPIVEINGRKTMSWAALQIQQRHCPDRALRFSFGKTGTTSLPRELKVNGKTHVFSRALHIEILPSAAAKYV